MANWMGCVGSLPRGILFVRERRPGQAAFLGLYAQGKRSSDLSPNDRSPTQRSPRDLYEKPSVHTGGFFVTLRRVGGLSRVNRAAIMQAAFYAVIAIGKEPSVREVCGMIRCIAGKGFRQEDVRGWLAEKRKRDTLGTQDGHKPDTVVTNKNGISGHKPVTNGKPSRAPHKVLESEVFSTLPSGEKQSKNGTAENERDWITALREQANRIGSKPLRDLTLDERVVVARYFAFRCAGCTKSEATNRNRAGKMTGAFARMADSKLFADMTVRDYVGEALLYRDRVMGGAPFHDPFAIRAVMGVA